MLTKLQQEIVNQLRENGELIEGYGTLANFCGFVDKTTIKSNVRKLQALGILEVMPNGSKATGFKLLKEI